MADQIRKAALETLLEKNEYAVSQESETLEKHREWDHRDGAFYTALVETELAHQVTIDAIIAAYASTRLKKIEPIVLGAIRIALAQIFFMDRVPDSAACNESVKLVKDLGKGKFAGFTNGIIRHIIREKDAPEARVIMGSDSVRLRFSESGWQVTDNKYRKYADLLDKSLRFSYPYWLIRFFEEKYPGKPVAEGLSTDRRLSAFTKTTDCDLPEEVTVESEYIITAAKDTDLAGTQAFKDGLFYIMDRSSMEPLLQAGLRQEAEVLDLCASPGGKSIEASILYNAKVMACDVSKKKTDRIRENALRMHLNDRIAVMENDATVFNEAFTGRFDAVIADCPCSGLGVSGRKPEIRLRLKPEDFAALAKIQKQILENAAEYVKLGGTLVYSTCTLDPLENEQQAEAFLSMHQDFSMEKQETIIPDSGHDGFYYAILRH